MTYCAYSIDDLREPLHYIHEKYCLSKKRDIFLIGSSMGANIVANYLGMEGDQCFVKAGCCLQPPFNMTVCGKNIERSLFGMYNKVLGQNLKRRFEPFLDKVHDYYFNNLNINIRDHH
jgi:predicted alpha/beta-fold hydrolase